MARSSTNATQATSESPEWCLKILEQLFKTILKPIIKLKPGGKVNWRNYGKMIGLFERYRTFIMHDLDRMFKEEGFDKITHQQWAQLEPQLGRRMLKEGLTVSPARPVANSEPLENLVL